MDTILIKPKTDELMVSEMAEDLIGSEILKIAAGINEMIRKGEKIYNYTVGDFDPEIFPIPVELKAYIIEAYNHNQTNYPPSDGVMILRQSVSRFLDSSYGLQYSPADEILIAGGARPILYSAYRALVDPGDYVLYPLPSWNNNHYTHLSGAKGIEIEASNANNFMPTADDIAPFIDKVTLISLCSPQNPTGTAFTEQGLQDICNLILEENQKRTPNPQLGAKGVKPVYLIYDQVYSQLTFGNTNHYNPVSLFPEMKDYTVFVDGISKMFSATGVRVGWSMGNKKIIDKMKSIIGHVGAWVPKPEQTAVAKYLDNTEAVNTFLTGFKAQIFERLSAFHKGFMQLKQEGFKVDAIEPQAAIYLTVQFDLAGMETPSSQVLLSGEDIMQYILHEAKTALVPFYAFGASPTSSWFRLSVGTSKLETIPDVFAKLKNALAKLNASSNYQIKT